MKKEAHNSKLRIGFVPMDERTMFIRTGTTGVKCIIITSDVVVVGKGKDRSTVLVDERKVKFFMHSLSLFNGKVDVLCHSKTKKPDNYYTDFLSQISNNRET